MIKDLSTEKILTIEFDPNVLKMIVECDSNGHYQMPPDGELIILSPPPTPEERAAARGILLLYERKAGTWRATIKRSDHDGR